MKEKLYISVICGGQSTEHEVSIQSARNVINSLDSNKYTGFVIYVDKTGAWYLIEDIPSFLKNDPAELIHKKNAQPITPVVGNQKDRPWQSLNDPWQRFPTDCIFPMIHGTSGEDGSLQGFLDLLGLPYVGSDAQSSAICMEKDVTKQLLRGANVPTLDWHTLYHSDDLNHTYSNLCEKFGNRMFVKAASLGSSVATLPVENSETFHKAVQTALRFDERVIVEPRVYGREIECSVLGNENPQASLPGEVIPHHEFYSYEAKYIDPNGATLKIPAELEPSVVKSIQKIAIQAFKATHCSGMARVDFFLLDNHQAVVNELNTIPGFTDRSMYPKMWEASGLTQKELVERLIELAFKRHEYQNSLIRQYQG